MRAARVYKKSKKTTVQLTSLLDLLFVMIFVSLIQQKNITPVRPEEVPLEKTEAKVTAKKITTYPVSAVFSFYSTPGNPSLPSGSYEMRGVFDEESRSLKLAGVSWIQRGPNYGMVPLTGSIESTNTLFTGKIDFDGCKLFTLKRIETINNQPISGKWQGVYDCQQGPTGLTLTIK